MLTHVCYSVQKYLTTILKYISTNLFELYISAGGRIVSVGFMFDSELLAREITDSEGSVLHANTICSRTQLCRGWENSLLTPRKWRWRTQCRRLRGRASSPSWTCKSLCALLLACQGTFVCG